MQAQVCLINDCLENQKENNVYVKLLLDFLSMETYVVQKWAASYYCWESKTWQNGKLHLCPKYICFFEDNSQPNTVPKITEDLRSITGFQRRLVSLIYKAIVVSVEGKNPLWFSSLQNREEVFYFLEHFWKERLLCLGPG